jgi:NAD(P)-dependent dehydrogenase (short-subunit alcohol dehydrogenase family)
MSLCDGRVAIVTGAARGIGRAHALELARQGASVVVNDTGVARDGSGEPDPTVAQEVTALIGASGGAAVVSIDDVATWEGARRVVELAHEAFGGLHAVVNNAGILRDRMLVNMTVEDWDAVIACHLRSTFAVTHWAADRWRREAKTGRPVDARVVNTSSASGLYGNVGQTNYGAAKAGIAAFSVIAAAELGRYGVTVNAIAPSARTRMTEDLGLDIDPPADGSFDAFDPANIAPLVAWLVSAEARDVTGRVFNVRGGTVSVAEGWSAGPAASLDERWDAGELGPVVRELLAAARPNADMQGRIPTA